MAVATSSRLHGVCLLPPPLDILGTYSSSFTFLVASTRNWTIETFSLVTWN
jgi:hypothetical protein